MFIKDSGSLIALNLTSSQHASLIVAEHISTDLHEIDCVIISEALDSLVIAADTVKLSSNFNGE